MIGSGNNFNQTFVEQKYIDRAEFLIENKYVILSDDPNAKMELAYKIQQEAKKNDVPEEYKGLTYI